MKSLEQFITVWKERDMGALVRAGASLPSPENVKAYLDTLDDAVRQRMLADLKAATLALHIHAENMQTEASALNAEIRKSYQRSQACLTYNTSQFKNDNRQR